MMLSISHHELDTVTQAEQCSEECTRQAFADKMSSPALADQREVVGLHDTPKAQFGTMPHPMLMWAP